MSKLWKRTFHDDEKYISMVFDTYFDPELCAYRFNGDELVAGLIGVPYNFGNAERQIRGLYLCGLATDQRYRSQGIMTALLNEINEKAAQRGFAFTFLIPADRGLRKYYADRDYVSAFYRVVDNYTSLHDFNLDFESLLADQKEKVAELKRRHYETLGTGILKSDMPAYAERREGIINLMINIESVQEDLQIIHSPRDIEVLIDENMLSGGEIHYTCTQSGEVVAVAFVTFDNTQANVVKLYATDQAAKYKVLGSIKRAHPERGISHFVPSIEMDRKALWSRTYGSEMKPNSQVPEISVTERVYSLAAHSKVYGMARILNLVEILKFQAEARRDLNYSILVKTADKNNVEEIFVKGPNIRIKQIKTSELSASQSAYLMSRRDVGEILFRRRDTDNLITEAFGIPSVNAAASLLLD
ncbi:MAG: GNAT family N-acetyltransferase [Muribaculaceae bacterium]|nr:GNAT family N-acetyltransferase [Muribaculaceae bacterium]